ncbi:N-acyl homoserine lactonase family protein [Burkholderiaceae bacterium FT117]|uniref:N-acyl homoserine lactonase family protein n=1 Tax=Zeimonas sediminis TaxID=2944268 RepID=UPI002342FB07|nr:N-acyl homoserine lactonase family protein [Zeimonas sediminis]MCM5572070.1 N-acyl homoserine lactonase family protein [Zeimonas sediminis]
MSLPTWEVFALRYATVSRRRLEMFIDHDLHDGPQEMDYFVWLIRRGDDVVLVDTGFNRAQADLRGRRFLRCPIGSLDRAGIPVDAIRDVVITHAHYDHAGNLDLLPRARFHLQEREMNYATGRDMRQKLMRHAYCVDDVCSLVRLVFEDRVEYHDGDWELRPGLTVHLVAGHTRGLQVVRVHTARGWIVLASDAAHYLENFAERSPFPIVADVGDMLRGHDLLERLAESPAHVVPGHDPIVMSRYARTGPAELEIVSLTEPLPQAPAAAPRARAR